MRGLNLLSLGKVVEMFRILAELRQVMNTELKLDQYSSYFVLSMAK